MAPHQQHNSKTTPPDLVATKGEVASADCRYSVRLADAKRLVQPGAASLCALIVATLMSSDFYSWQAEMTNPIHRIGIAIHLAIAVHLLTTRIDNEINSGILLLTGAWNLSIHMTTTVTRDMGDINMTTDFAFQDLVHNLALDSFLHFVHSPRLGTWCYVLSSIGVCYHVVGIISLFFANATGWTGLLTKPLVLVAAYFKPMAIDADVDKNSALLQAVREFFFQSDVTVLTIKTVLLALFRQRSPCCDNFCDLMNKLIFQWKRKKSEV